MNSKAANRASWRCLACGKTAREFMPRCPGCHAWDTFRPGAAVPARAQAKPTAPAAPIARDGRAVLLSQLSTAPEPRIPSGIAEFDRVLGGGWIAGTTTLVCADPGAGKSTLALQLAALFGRSALLVVNEQPARRVAKVAGRCGLDVSKVFVWEGNESQAAFRELERVKPAFVVVDSIQRMLDTSLKTRDANLHCKSSAELWTGIAQAWGFPLLLVAQVTKDGDLAGPRALEHIVDTFLEFKVERDAAGGKTNRRVLVPAKNRDGDVEARGAFVMTGRGLVPAPDQQQAATTAGEG